MKHEKPMDYLAARDLLLARTAPLPTEHVPVMDCGGRILAETLAAAEDIPAFDRSPYDGYAFRAGDLADASREKPVTLRILEEVPAGATPTVPVTAGCATKVLTGAPLPEGADTILNYEVTEFTAETVTFFAPVKPGSNVVRRGEDVKAGTVLLRPGAVIDAGAAGVLSAQGVAAPLVYRKPRVAVLSTGSELVEAEETPGAGKIRNSNSAMLAAALRKYGMEPVNLGIAGDDAAAIAALFEKGLADCDAVVSTGGVSVGDYDLTPDAMERVGAEMLLRGVALKPGMACAYALREGKLLCGLSGNPASSITNFYAVALPALKKLAGRADAVPAEFPVRLKNGFPKPSRALRLLRGKLELDGTGAAQMLLPSEQGNVVLSSTIGCDLMAVIPGGSGPLEPGTVLRAFRI